MHATHRDDASGWAEGQRPSAAETAILLPAPPDPRQRRRARLVAHLARRRFGYTMLHIALGLAGWATLAAALAGVIELLD